MSRWLREIEYCLSSPLSRKNGMIFAMTVPRIESGEGLEETRSPGLLRLKTQEAYRPDLPLLFNAILPLSWEKSIGLFIT